jgi:hypothetical protein
MSINTKTQNFQGLIPSTILKALKYLIRTPFLHIALGNPRAMRNIFSRFSRVFHDHYKEFLFFSDKKKKKEIRKYKKKCHDISNRF